jgi:hypothetical protein
MVSRWFNFSPRSRIRAIAMVLALAAAGVVGPTASPAQAHTCSHQDHSDGNGWYFDYQSHHTHSDGPPYYGVHHVVFVVYPPLPNSPFVYHGRHNC